MAAKTQFSGNDFTDILSRYDLGRYTASLAIEAGTIQTNYAIHTTRGKFVFRLYENRSRESVLFERDLLLFLTHRGYPCPAPLPDRQGEHVGTVDAKPYMVFEFVDGRHVEHPGPYHRQQLIRRAAELQTLTTDFHSPYTPYRWNYEPGLCRRLAHAEAARLDTPAAWAKFAWLAHELKHLDLPPSLPRGVCHSDFHFSNVLFREDEFVALIDFDDANVTYLQFDLVGLIESRAWPYPATTLDVARARNVVQEYTRHRPLSRLEQRHLYDVYKLSILFDCVWFFKRGTARNCYERRKIEALKALGRHRLVEALFPG